MKFRGKALCVKLRVPCGDPGVTSEHMQDFTSFFCYPQYAGQKDWKWNVWRNERRIEGMTTTVFRKNQNKTTYFARTKTVVIILLQIHK